MFGHAVGGGALPAPPWLLSYIGVALVLGTAAALRATWPRARRPAVAPAAPDAPRVGPGHVAGTALYAGTVALALAGPDASYASFVYWFVLVVWWVALPIACLLVGDVFRAVNPFVLPVALLDRGRPTADRAAPTWTAAAFLAVWSWYLLAYHALSPTSLGVLLVVYALLVVAGGLRWGRSWVATGDAFGLLSAVVARIGLRGRRPRDLVPGTALAMVVWIGGTAFDGFTYQTFWQDVLGTADGWSRTLLNTAGLVWITAMVGGAFLLVVRIAERAQREEDAGRRLAEPFGLALVPLAVGWFLGHDLTLLLAEGQNAYALASDPLGRGWDLFGTITYTIDYTIVTRAWVPWVQLVLITAGHLSAVVLLHELALERMSPRAAMRTTWVMALVASASITGAALLVLA